jgi:Tfp pilus assembly PilM family ATPase
MSTPLFFKLFPPPKFMVMKHVGLDISDDAIHCLEYSGQSHNMKIVKHVTIDLPEGVIVGGEIKDEKALCDVLLKLDKDLDLTYVKVSVPEEKSYLFQTDISTTNPVAIAQNVEFKLEENVPLSVPEAVFYFDILPMSVTGGKLRASVSVVPKVYIENIIAILRKSGLSPIAFEVVPKSVARAVLPNGSQSTVMIVHIMNNKTGIYVVCGGVVCFTSTIAWGSKTPSEQSEITSLSNEIIRINEYWLSHNVESSKIEQIVVVGRDALRYESMINEASAKVGLPVSVGNVWTNAFSVNDYVPPIFREDSLEYAVSAGLAMDI